MHPRQVLKVTALVPAVALVVAMLAAPAAHATPRLAPVVGPVTKVSKNCKTLSFGNAEVETASDPRHGYVYDLWINCAQIGFARSADGGRTWGRAIDVPRPAHARTSWDPAIVVGPSGTVYAAFMVFDVKLKSSYPVVDISTDHGATFRVRKLSSPHPGNFGDRDFIAVGPRGQIYVTWDYGPDAKTVKSICFTGGSCAFKAGDVNAVVQKSTDGGRTWSAPVPVAPGFPHSGSISAPILVTPSGRVDVLFERYQVSPVTLALGPGHDYFTSSGDGGKSWSRPVMLGSATDTVSPHTWWIDGSLAADSAGNLYASWDTQSGGTDAGWLSYSVNAGRTWSAPVRVTSGTGEAVNIVQVLGGSSGRAYVGLLTDSAGHYVQHLRAFSVKRGWIMAPVRVSRHPGLTADWAGDTIGLARDGGGPGHRRVAVSWGSTLSARGRPQIWAAVVSRLP
jgi:hypothetical protein